MLAFCFCWKLCKQIANSYELLAYEWFDLGCPTLQGAKTTEIAKGHVRNVLSAFNVKRTRDIREFPPEFLKSEDSLMTNKLFVLVGLEILESNLYASYAWWLVKYSLNLLFTMQYIPVNLAGILFSRISSIWFKLNERRICLKKVTTLVSSPAEICGFIRDISLFYY